MPTSQSNVANIVLNIITSRNFPHGYYLTITNELCEVGDEEADFSICRLTDDQANSIKSISGVRSFQALFPTHAPTIVWANADESYVIEHEVSITYINNPDKLYTK